MKKKKKTKVMKEKKIKVMEKYNIDKNMFSEEEREVSELLVELHHVILDLEVPLISLLPFSWGCKRIRSSIQYYNPTTIVTTCAAIAPPPLHHGGAAVSTPFEAASSPATPLSLSLTESDDKAKKTLQGKASLEKEINNVKHYSEHLKASNLKFKARKQELSYSYNSYNKSEAKKPKLGSECPMQFVYATNPINSPNPMVGNLQYTTQYVALMLNQTCGSPQICNTEGISQFQYVSCNHSMPMQMASSSSSLSLLSSPNSSTAALGLVNNTSSNMGQIGILDLNVSSEEFIHVDSCQPLDLNVVNKDLNRVIAAQARQRRIQINKLKNPIGNSQTRYSYG
ncbi:hypothetical protein Lal_00003177 [Lupinus albus]|uniref:Uncharacterized protein n=1 Tax=Lupinus albus TaxID=3870 RepID=A0A6A5NN24_LUPAL|nr:hypothetical protein Lalb_Chr22g0354321 [Lupinus albus]KAF1882995.1 hypothetical protein Lal_00003177 [Lupinus albus]